MADKNYLSKVKLSNNIYYLKDSEARDLLSAVTTAVSQGLVIKVVQTLPLPSKDTMGKIYLIPMPDTAKTESDIHAEYITVHSGTSESAGYYWEKIGSTKIDLRDVAPKTHKHAVSISATTAHTLGINATFKGESRVITISPSYAGVIGTGSTMQASSSSVSFGTHTTKAALGTGATIFLPERNLPFVPGSTGTTKVLGSGTTFTMPQKSVTGRTDSFRSFVASDTTLTVPSGIKVGSFGVEKDTVLGSDTTFTAAASNVTHTSAHTVSVIGENATMYLAPTKVNIFEDSKKLETKQIKNIETTSITVYTSGSTPLYTVAVDELDHEMLDFSVVSPVTISNLGKVNGETSVATGKVVSADTVGSSVIVDVISGQTVTGSVGFESKDPTTVIDGLPTTFTAAAQNITVDSNDIVSAVTVVASAQTSESKSVTKGTCANALTEFGWVPETTITVGTNNLIDAVTKLGQIVEGERSVSAKTFDTVNAITALGAGTAAAQTISWNNKDAKQVVSSVGTPTTGDITVTVVDRDLTTAITGVQAEAKSPAITVE